MTTSLVSGLDSLQNLMPNTQMSANQSSGSDFSDVLKNSTQKTGENTDNLKNSKQDASDDKNVKKADEIKTDDKPVKNEKTEKTDKASEKEEVNQTSKDQMVSEETDELSEEAVEVVAQITLQMVDAIAEVLDVPVEQVEEALTALGIEGAEVLDSSLMPQIAVELTDAVDQMEIMTDEKMFADVKELMTEAEDLMDQLSQELEIPVEDLKKQIQNTVAEERPSTDDNQMIKEDTNQMAAPETVATAETDDSSNKSNLKQNDKNNNNDVVNQFTQTVSDTIKDIVAEKIEEAPLSYTDTSESIMEQVTESLKFTMKEDMTEMELQLHPASLGNVKVNVASKDGVITANFTTQNETVKAALEAQIVQLKEQMNEQGIKVAAVEVTVSSHAFERNLNEGNQQGSGETNAEAKKKSRRSITLDGIDDELAIEDEEEKLVADMMARSGNSVDYLA